MDKSEESTLRKTFDQFDKDNNGYINKEELSSFAIALNNPLLNAELCDFYKEMDTDRNGKISWTEFIKYWSTE